MGRGMKWKLSEWAAVAEIIAAVGVILSLIFVGLQISEGNQETRAAFIQAASDSDARMITTLISHKDTWEKVLTGAPLEEGAELRGAILLFNLLMVNMDNRYNQFRSGFLDNNSWDGFESILSPLIKLPIFKIWRETPGAHAHTTEFLNLLDSLAMEAPDE
jgi:hypothetical protein